MLTGTPASSARLSTANTSSNSFSIATISCALTPTGAAFSHRIRRAVSSASRMRCGVDSSTGQSSSETAGTTRHPRPQTSSSSSKKACGMAASISNASRSVPVNTRPASARRTIYRKNDGLPMVYAPAREATLMFTSEGTAGPPYMKLIFSAVRRAGLVAPSAGATCPQRLGVERCSSMIEPSVYNKCVRCGLCLPTCPTYVETLTETSGPRGRISLIKAVAEERLDLLSPGFVHQMSECLDCRACEAVCPSGVQYGSLVEAARAQIEKARAPKRGFVSRIVRQLLLRGMNLEEAEMLAPAISPSFFVPRNQRYEARHSRASVMLHAGCVMHVAFTHVDDATVRVLRRNGFSVVVPAAQGCCGAVAVHAGEMDFGLHLAKRNIAAFENSRADFYIVNAAGCGSTLKEYGRLLARDAKWADRAARFSARVRDVLEFLDESGISDELGPVDAAVTYQDACHLAHAQRIAAAPRRLLDRIPGLRLVEMNESSLCCGSAGIYNITQPEMAERLGSRKIENVIATGAAVVATANPGCALQLNAQLRKRESSIRVMHVIELLEQSYAAYSEAASRSRSFSAASSEP